MSIKQIHIEKYDIGSFEKEGKPYVMIRTDIIQKMVMHHAQEFLLWIYLESLPPTWKPCKGHLTNHFNISDRTYERYMGWLNGAGLIEYRQNRGASGSFGKGHLVVLDGSRFNIDAITSGTVTIGGTAINKKKTKVIHNLDDHRTAKFGGTGQSSTARSHKGLSEISPNRQFTEVRCDDGHINTTVKEINKRKKTNNSVTVFSDTDSVKTHIDLVVANRRDQEPLNDDIVDQGIFYSFTKNSDHSFDSVNKRINIFLKKVREGKWLIPQGWNGISSQSIREKEEREREVKQQQYRQEATAFREISKKALSPMADKSLSDILKKLKTG